MNELYTFSLLAFTAFFTIINPLGTMPIFMSMTASLSKERRKQTAKKATIVAFFTVIAFAFSGQVLFNFFGISVNSFRIVGGLIFFMMGWDMLQARLGQFKHTDDEEQLDAYVEDISITPLAIPMICGPGAITNAIILMEDADNYQQKIVLIATIAFVLLLTYWVLVGASKITEKLGSTGNKVMMRLMGLIVMVIAVEFFFSGLKPIILGIMKG
ncbi:NAAT family transporter [Lutibacter sp. HS1-25]|uniref:MarC family protein n=1 Tax=Lutibacter sp. HS1-25 TaxID=2485000 RepID=UPI001012258F|nr:MarC family protein [Lutibacter sp. HS1-25]RXP53224.1 NAAT family transporter [Lutibacter sp. HS1-25]